MAEQRSTPQLLVWLWHHGKRLRMQTALNMLTGLLSVGAGLAFVAITKTAIDVATHKTEVLSLTQVLVLLVAVMLFQIGINFSNRWIRALLGVRAQNSMQLMMFRRMLSRNWMSIRHYHSGDVLNRLFKDVGTLVGLLTDDIPGFFTTIVQFVGAFVFLSMMDARLAWIIVAILPMTLILSKLYMRKLRKLTHEGRAEESRVQSAIQEAVQHSLVIKTLDSLDYVVGKVGGTQQRLHRKVVEKTKYSSFSATLVNLGFSAGYMVTFGWGVFQLQHNAITYGVLLAFIQLVGQIQGPLRALSGYVPTFINAATACERLMELERLPADRGSLMHVHPADLAGATEQGQDVQRTRLDSGTYRHTSNSSRVGLRFSHVTYRYTPTSRTVLRDFSYYFSPGSVTAILGETGVGKTTLVRLLLSLIRPVGGSMDFVLEDGSTVGVKAESRHLFAYVPQGNSLLSGTIRDNLALADPQATEADMRKVLSVAGADFVFSLPAGLDTHCTEHGGGLSEGQAQRVCIARALLRPCPFMLFDESTSALDESTEESVIRGVVEYCAGRTLIFVTHRPAVLRYCTQQLHLTRKSVSVGGPGTTVGGSRRRFTGEALS